MRTTDTGSDCGVPVFFLSFFPLCWFADETVESWLFSAAWPLGAAPLYTIRTAQSAGGTRGGFVITQPIGLLSPPLWFPLCLSLTGDYLFSLFGSSEWRRQSRPSRPIELWHNRCNTSMHLSQEPLIRPSCSFHQFAAAPVGLLGGMGVRQPGLLHCM